MVKSDKQKIGGLKKWNEAQGVPGNKAIQDIQKFEGERLVKEVEVETTATTRKTMSTANITIYNCSFHNDINYP